VLVAPVEDELLLSSSDMLLIVPDLDLATVPWAALRNAAGRHLIEDFSIRISPSLSVSRQAALPCNKAAPAAPVQPKITVVGNPWPTGLRGLFYPLHEAEAEADSVALHFAVNHVSLLKGPNATKAAVLCALEGADLVHLACHGWLERDALVLAQDSGLQSQIAQDEVEGNYDEISRGLLTKEEIYSSGRRLAAQSTVVLSACNTGRGAVCGEGVIGISRAFLAAGAGAVVMSLWSVPDRHTRLLMEAVYGALAQGHSTPQALRFGMVMMLRYGNTAVQRALAWAGFIVVGGCTALPPQCLQNHSVCPYGISSSVSTAAGGWGVEEVSSLFEGCGLSAVPVRNNSVDGKTLLSLTDLDLMDPDGFGLSLQDVGRLKVALTSHVAVDAVYCGSAGEMIASNCRSASQGSVMDLATMEHEFRRSNADWFLRIRAPI
jgi:hypothetical protein